MKTIQELVISIATTETKMMAEKGRGFNNEGELSAEAQSVANQLFDVAWTKEFEMDDEAVYQEDRFGVPCEVLRYEEKYPKMDKVKATYE